MSRVVIVGGGIAGLVLATHLGRSRPAGSDHDILLVDRNFAHVWKPMLHRFAAGTATYATQSIPFASQAKRNGFRYEPGDLVGLDRTRKIVSLGPLELPDGRATLAERTVPYDTLVLAIGSRSDDFDTPGVAEHCLFVDDIGQAETINRTLRSRVLEATVGGTDPAIVIVGGGATGVELAAELTETSALLARYTPELRTPRLRITLIERGPRVLAPFPDAVSRDATAKLTQLGVDVRQDTKVTSVDDGGVTLGDGERIEASIRVWAAGVRAPAVASRLDGLEVNAKGQVVVRTNLQSPRDAALFALGDCASLKDPTGRPLPTTAQVARQQALFLARTLGRSTQSGAPGPVFQYSDKGSIVTLGPYGAYASLGQHGLLPGATLKGLLAEIGHAALYRMHQLDLLGIVRGGVGWLADDLLHAVRPRLGLD